MPLTLDGSNGIEFPDGGTHAKAWLHFQGTGTATVRDSGNISSLSDNGTGDFTANFSVSFADIYYTIAGAAADGNTGNRLLLGFMSAAPTTSAHRFETVNGSFGNADTTYAGAVFHK